MGGFFVVVFVTDIFGNIMLMEFHIILYGEWYSYCKFEFTVESDFFESDLSYHEYRDLSMHKPRSSQHLWLIQIFPLEAEVST